MVVVDQGRSISSTKKIGELLQQARRADAVADKIGFRSVGLGRGGNAAWRRRIPSDGKAFRGQP